MVGIANLDEVPADVRHNFPVGISIAVALDPQTVSGITEGPTRQYYDEYERANDLLERLGNRAGEFLDECGHKSLPLAVTSVGIDSETISTRLPYKTVATRAGLGWIGKCALLVTKGFGSAIRITTVLTDARLQTDYPVNADLCGTCSSCVDSCPAHAPSGSIGRSDFIAMNSSTHLLVREMPVRWLQRG